MIVRETKNVDDIRKVLCHPEIYPCIGDDNSPDPSEFMPIISDKYLYIAGYVNNEIMAVVVYHKFKDGNECHVQILPEYRKDYAVEFGVEGLKFRPDAPLYAEIPINYQNVVDYAILNGFEVVNTKVDGHLQDGVLYPVLLLEFRGVQDGCC